MLRSFAALAALALAALPLAARADGVDFTAPDYYMVEPSAPSLGLTGAVFRDWGRLIGGVRHSLVASSSPPPGGRSLTELLDATVAGVVARGGVDVERAAAEPLCGEPSVRIAYAYRSSLHFEFRYAIVGGRLLIASYAHPVGTPDDPISHAALSTLCSGVHQPAAPAGWTLLAPFPANGSAWRRGPDDFPLVVQTVAPGKTGTDAATAPYTGKDTVLSDRREPCGTVTVHRVTSEGDGKIFERAYGTVRGYDYVASYIRASSTPSDPGALATITSFCADPAPSER